MGGGQSAVGNGRGKGDQRRAQIATYRDLDVWQLGMDTAADAYELTRGFPREELFGMTSQIRRSAASIPANIAEGYGRDNRVTTFTISASPKAASRTRLTFCSQSALVF